MEERPRSTLKFDRYYFRAFMLISRLTRVARHRCEVVARASDLLDHSRYATDTGRIGSGATVNRWQI